MSSIKIKQINNEFVKPVRFQDEEIDPRPIKGEALFNEIYSNIFVVAKKKSGKTTVLYKIVKDCTTTDTTVLVFSSTLDKDKAHKGIKQYCEYKGIPYVGYTSMKDGDVDILDVLIKDLQEKAKQKEEESDSEEEVKHGKLVLFESSEDDEDYIPKKRKNKFRAPEYLIILDDMSNELKSKTLVRLLKMNRHFFIKLLVSTQYPKDCLPESIKQMDYALLFKGESEDKLLKLHKDFDLAIEFEVFKQLYHNATAEKYNFLYIDIREERYRKNFNKEYDLSKI